ncbi:MAG: hypothetical protein WAU47_08930 [Desulfobaccales bacterium]
MKKLQTVIMLGLAMSLFAVAAGTGAGTEEALQKALLAYLDKTGNDPQSIDPHQTALVDLNGDGQEDALVLLQGPFWCGSGGCTLLVFTATNAGFQFVSSSTLIRGPVLVGETKTCGWRDLVVNVSGGGAKPKRVALKFDGKQYPRNPSVQKPLPDGVSREGVVVFKEKP